MSSIVLAKHLVKYKVWRYAPINMRAAIRGRLNRIRYPKRVYFEITTRCPLRCVMCGRTYWKRPQKADMPFDFFKRVVDQLTGKGLEVIHLQGQGECLLHRDLIEMVEYVRERGIETQFNTSLTVFSDEMAERLVKAGHSEITISIDAMDPEIYADIRRGAKLETVLENVARLHRAKARNHSALPRMKVETVLLKPVAMRLREHVERVKALGVFKLLLADMNTEGVDLSVRLHDGSPLGENHLSTIPQDELKRIFDGVRDLADTDFQIEFPGQFIGWKHSEPKFPGVISCVELWEAPYITPDGYLTPCCWAPDQSLLNMGNLNENTFHELWFGERYREIRRQHIFGTPPKQCRGCQEFRMVFEPDSHCFDKCPNHLMYQKCFYR